MGCNLQEKKQTTQSPYRRLLLHKKADLLRALRANCRQLSVLQPEVPGKREEISSDEHVQLRMNQDLCEQIRQVEEALDRLELKEYGACLRCGSTIPAKRLQVIPWARYCVPCQERSVASGPATAAADEAYWHAAGIMGQVAPGRRRAA